MKVMCINNGKLRNHLGKINSAPELIEGETYTVIGISNTGHGYILLEVKHGEQFSGFTKERFIPLSEIDETELVNQRLQTA